MKLFFTSVIILLLTIAQASSKPPGDSIKTKAELPWKQFTDGFAEAKKSEKKIMVDVYTNWCGWCKRLDADVYSNPEIVSYMQNHFVSVKLNAESSTQISYKDTAYSQTQFSQALGVSGYPTIAFFDSKGEFITKLGGYVAADRFLPIVKFIGEDYYKKMSWEDYMKETNLKASPSKPPKNK